MNVFRPKGRLGALQGAGVPAPTRQGALALPDFGAPGIAEQKPLPAPPRDTNPWSKENRSRTLRDIGSAFLSNENSFFGGLGAAGKAVTAREDELTAGPKREYGGPDDRFEILTDPRTGERTVTEVPEFAKAIEARDAAKRLPSAPSVKDQVELRARTIRAIGSLPPEQRNAAYAAVMNNPAQYGGIDTTGMPPGWDESYAGVMGNLGQTVSQAESQDDRRAAFQHRQVVDNRRLGQTDARMAQTASTAASAERRRSLPKAPKSRSGAAKAKKANVPAGFILD